MRVSKRATGARKDKASLEPSLARRGPTTARTSRSPRPTTLVIHGLDVDDMRGDKMSKAMSYTNGIELLSGLGVLPKPGAAPAGATATRAQGAGAAREAPRKK